MLVSTSDSVTAVIPTFNCARYITQTVDSALNQTYPCEVIVVDDGSTDDTALLLRRFAGRITYIKQQNEGVSAARNNGIRRASGDWIALLDSDDLWHPSKTELQLRLLRKNGNSPRIGMIGSRASQVLPAILPPDPLVRRLTVRDFLLTVPMSTSGALIRRACFDRVGYFDPRFGPASDRDMWLRMSAIFETLEIRSPCWYYRLHNEQMSNKSIEMNDELCRVLGNFFVEHPNFKNLRRLAFSYAHVDAALAHLDLEERIPALSSLLKSFLAYPRSYPDPLRPSGWRLKLLAKMILRPNRGVFARLL